MLEAGVVEAGWDGDGDVWEVLLGAVVWTDPPKLVPDALEGDWPQPAANPSRPRLNPVLIRMERYDPRIR